MVGDLARDSTAARADTILSIEHVMRAVMALAAHVSSCTTAPRSREGRAGQVVRDPRRHRRPISARKRSLMLTRRGPRRITTATRGRSTAYPLEVEQGAIVAIVGANGAGRALAHPHHQPACWPARAARSSIVAAISAGWPSHRVCDLGIGQVAGGRRYSRRSRSPKTSLWARCCLARAPAGRERNLERVSTRCFRC